MDTKRFLIIQFDLSHVFCSTSDDTRGVNDMKIQVLLVAKFTKGL